MDAITIGIFFGMFLAGIIAGIPIGSALEHFDWSRFGNWPSKLNDEVPTGIFLKEEVEDILNAREIS